MEEEDHTMSMNGHHIIDSFDTFDPARISVLSPTSDYVLNGANGNNNDTPPATIEADTRIGGLLTPTGTISATNGVPPVIIDDKSTVNRISPAKEELTEEELKELKRAQNRAAQRAFRERKEAKLKELEQRLRCSEIRRKHLADELERLREENLRINIENKRLLEQGVFDIGKAEGAIFTFPRETDRERLYSGKSTEKYSEDFIKAGGHYYDASGKEILTVPATWDYLQILSEQVDFDVASVLANLKGNEVCHGFGAAYPRALIDQLVQEQYLRDAGRI